VRDLGVDVLSDAVSSLNIHSNCRGPLAIDDNPTGWFWDTGVGAVAYNGGDRWSINGAMERYTWADLGPTFADYLPSALQQLLESSSQ
jgi:hypothetical protein